MTLEQQRIAIAEACGWTNRAYLNQYNEPKTMWHHPDGAPIGYTPDYLNDLNAMHEAEAWLKEQPDHEYSHNCICTYDAILRRDFGPRATAAQRAEAFLKTLNLWKP